MGSKKNEATDTFKEGERTMRKATWYFPILMSIFIIISGCSAKLSDKKEPFEADGIDYQFQLPSTWEPTKDYKTTYNKSAVFGAKDKKSNSSLFILASRKEEVDLNDFGKRTRKELAKLYNYKPEDIYLKESKVGGYKAYKYTLYTTFEDRSYWLHLYYIETEHGFIQLDFYSADDGNYKKRTAVIDSSAYSIKEVKDNGPEKEEDEIAFDSPMYNLKVTGVMDLAGDKETSVYAIRYAFTNKGDNGDVTPEKWNELIQVTQNDQVLVEGKAKEDEQVVDISKLLKQRAEKIPTGKTIEAVVVYTLKDKKSNIELTPSKEIFKDAESVQLTLSTTGGKEDEK